MLIKLLLRLTFILDNIRFLFTCLSVIELLIQGFILFQLLSDHIDDLIFYYGASDPWTPRLYYNEMVTRFPTAQIYLCEKNMRHAFVLESHHEMAQIVADWIESN
jgi:hypothetical protein